MNRRQLLRALGSAVVSAPLLGGYWTVQDVTGRLFRVPPPAKIPNGYHIKPGGFRFFLYDTSDPKRLIAPRNQIRFTDAGELVDDETIAWPPVARTGIYGVALAMPNGLVKYHQELVPKIVVAPDRDAEPPFLGDTVKILPGEMKVTWT